MSERILLIGAGGQLGAELIAGLSKIYKPEHILATDIRIHNEISPVKWQMLDVLHKHGISEVFSTFRPTQVYHLAAMLSATAERHPKAGWTLNMDGLFNVFDAALEYGVKKLFWPSSIAVFGPNTPRTATPQHTVMDPTTVYGITKQAGERYCDYYFRRYGLDVRSLRYPGLIGWRAEPGGGTTDYAVDIYHQALKSGQYQCFLKADTRLPMMHMDDAVRGTLMLMESPAAKIRERSSYNFAGLDFTPAELAVSIQQHLPEFKISYKPDERQAIADSWPQSIDDSVAREHWGWQPEYNIEKLTSNMLENLGPRYRS